MFKLGLCFDIAILILILLKIKMMTCLGPTSPLVQLCLELGSLTLTLFLLMLELAVLELSLNVLERTFRWGCVAASWCLKYSRCVLCSLAWFCCARKIALSILLRGGVEDTRLEAKDTKNPRPRTAFPRTDPLEAKNRNARGRGQKPKTQPQVFSKKKRS